MDRGLYIAASGMLAEQRRSDQIANDLANASTAGYKADRSASQSFGNLLLANTKTGQTIGSQSLGVQIAQISTDFTPAPLKDTGQPLDFGIAGTGFFALQTAGGTRYTRDGQFQAGADGTLQDAMGNKVLGKNNQPITVKPDGTVDPTTLGVFNLNTPAKQGDDLVTGTPTGGTTGAVRSGSLEESGADPARSMVDMIASLRAFEAGQKVMTTIDETLGKAATSVGTLSGG